MKFSVYDEAKSLEPEVEFGLELHNGRLHVTARVKDRDLWWNLMTVDRAGEPTIISAGFQHVGLKHPILT